MPPRTAHLIRLGSSGCEVPSVNRIEKTQVSTEMQKMQWMCRGAGIAQVRQYTCKQTATEITHRYGRLETTDLRKSGAVQISCQIEQISQSSTRGDCRENDVREQSGFSRNVDTSSNVSSLNSIRAFLIASEMLDFHEIQIKAASTYPLFFCFQRLICLHIRQQVVIIL